ncbi:MAG TPA: dihydrofolate reductase [Hyphomicrobiaceae bacterium]|nr:dihydrofolate reductase [Hyphomicrobiaceae bacterium]
MASSRDGPDGPSSGQQRSLPRVAFAVAAAENSVIGRGGKLPWRMPSDLRLFRRLTLGKPIIMGRHTLEAIGRPLDGRDNIVLSRDDNLAQHWPGVLVVSSPDEALRVAREKAATRGADEIMVIGGAAVYAAMLVVATRIYLTRVHAQPAGDTYLPTIDWQHWTETQRCRLPVGPEDDHPATLIVFDRIIPAHA